MTDVGVTEVFGLHGTVSFFHDRKMYGFIESEELDDDVFFHIDDLDVDSIEEGTEVEFETEEADKGPRATNVQVL